MSERSERTSQRSERELAAEVRRALRHQADELDLVDVPFDPAAPGLPGLERGDEDAPDAGRRRWSLVAAAAAVVVAVGAGALVAADDEPPADRTGPGVDAPTTTVSIPAGAADAGPGWLPTTPPEGMEAWSVRWGATVDQQPALVQLFEARSTGARLLVVVHPASRVDQPTDRAVRGRPAASYSVEEPVGNSTLLAWEEDGALVTAERRGMAEADAIGFLDGLRWRSDAPAGGFANPTSGPLDLAAEAEGGPVEIRTTTVVYRDAVGSVDPGEGEQLTVRTGVPVDDEGPTVGAVQDRYLGTVDDDGRVTRFDPDTGVLRRTDPDGTWVEVDANATTDDEDALATVADGVTRVEPAALLTLRAEVEARVVAAVPVVAQVGIEGSGDERRATVERREEGGAEAICLVVDGSPRRCSGAGVVLDAEGSFLVGDRWFVVGLGRDAVTIAAEPSVADGSDGSDGSDGPDLDGVRRGQAEGWHAALVVVPDAVDGVAVDGEGVRRPLV